MTEEKVDYIIVGQGLAGSCLALQLLFREKCILVIDQHNPNSASRVAAGLFNPITGRQMGKTWLADELFPYLHSFYLRAQSWLNQPFYFPMPLYRPFLSVEEQNEWMGRSAEPNYSKYLRKLETNPVFTQFVKNEFGGLLLNHCGYVNTNTFLNAVRNFIREKFYFLEEPFSEDELRVGTEGVRYKNFSASKIIYCTGEQIRQSKYFSWLPVLPLKGETLTISPHIKPDIVLNRGVYVVPDIWKVGATYNKQDQSADITDAGYRELTTKLDELVCFGYSVSAQDWGFRPTTPDRRPIIGSHPQYEQLVIFNGLGTKGVSLAPYFSDVLVNWLEKGTVINQLVSLNRYKSLYSKSA